MLDFGVIVFGAEAARLFCELGADVIKVESTGVSRWRARIAGALRDRPPREPERRGQPPQLRGRRGGQAPRGLLRRAAGQLQAGDAGEARTGGGDAEGDQPPAGLVNGSALGATGPWSRWMGYGPLVRCVSGLTSLWRYPDDDASFSDSTVIHPDHHAARVCASATLAALIAPPAVRIRRRDRVSQAETILEQLAACWRPSRWRGFAQRRPAPPGTRRRGACTRARATTSGASSRFATTRTGGVCARRSVHPSWAAEAKLATASGRVAHRREIDEQLSAWTRERAPASGRGAAPACRGARRLHAAARRIRGRSSVPRRATSCGRSSSPGWRRCRSRTFRSAQSESRRRPTRRHHSLGSTRARSAWSCSAWTTRRVSGCSPPARSKRGGPRSGPPSRRPGVDDRRKMGRTPHDRARARP